MKKALLLSIITCFMLVSFAQKNMKLHPVSTKYQPKEMIAPEKDVPFVTAVNQPQSFTKKVNGRDLTFIPIGQSGNAFGFYSNPRTYLWADQRINSVSFVYRMLADAGTYGNSRIAYSASWNGGVDGSWTTYLQVYNPTGPGSPYPDAAGRYPQGGIINPPGNTDPDNAYLTYFIPTLDNSNLCGTNPWGGLAYGVNNLTTVAPPAPTQTNIQSGGDFWHLIPDAFTITQDGHCWMVDGNNFCDAGAYVYDGNLDVFHGVFDPDEGDVVYEEYLLEALGYGDGINDVKVAFAPDGQTGYICVMSDTDVSDPQPSNGYHPILFKTTDGGENWGDPVHVLLGGYDGIDAIKEYWSDEALLSTDQYSGGFDRDTVWYNMGFHVDMIVDAYGNPHITGLITVAAPGGWYPYQGTMATWDLFSNDGGESFDAVALYDNLYFDGVLGGANSITEYNRPQVSSTIDGKYLFFSCIDTDFEGIEDNTQPDIFCCSYDIDNDVYTEMVNVTQFTDAWLLSFEGSQSHYVFSELNGTTLTCTVPLVYMDMDVANGINPVDFWYIDGWTYQFTVQSQTPPPTNLAASVTCYDVELSWDAPVGGTPLGYNIYRNNVKINDDPVTELTYLDAGVSAGTYSYKVTAVYGGGESDPTLPAQAVVESIDPVADVLATNAIGTPDVMVTWSVPVAAPLALDGFNIYRNEVKLNEVLITDLFYEDLGLENGAYTYCVTAVYQEVCESEQVCSEVFVTVGIAELENSFAIYPNPVKGILNMEFNVNIKSVRILNDMGVTVYTNEKISQDKVLQVNVSGFEPGIYFVQVKTDMGLAVKKLTVH
jgi:hypothetical protein